MALDEGAAAGPARLEVVEAAFADGELAAEDGGVVRAEVDDFGAPGGEGDGAAALFASAVEREVPGDDEVDGFAELLLVGEGGALGEGLGRGPGVVGVGDGELVLADVVEGLGGVFEAGHCLGHFR